MRIKRANSFLRSSGNFSTYYVYNPLGDNPTISVHINKKEALAEAKRLAKLYPDERIIISKEVEQIQFFSAKLKWAMLIKFRAKRLARRPLCPKW